jgi:hypothetical protein
VGFCLTAIRIWQWSSSFFVYASISLLYDHIQKNRLGENNRMRGVQVLVCHFSCLSYYLSRAQLAPVHVSCDRPTY